MKRFVPRTRGSWPRCLQPFDLTAYAAAMAIGYGVKRHFSTASAEELQYLLRPTAALVEYATGHEFVAERGIGFFCRQLHLVIAPVCSGANFLVVAFAALVFGFSSRTEHASGKLVWFLASAALAYSATPVINALRITLWLHSAPAHVEGLLSAEACHRLVGIVSYLGGLLLLYALAAKVFAKRSLATIDFAVPLALYFAVTLLVPWLRGVSQPAYWDHAAAVATVVSAAALLLLGTSRLLRGNGEGRVARRSMSDGWAGGRRIGSRCLNAGRCNQAIQELEQRALDLRPTGRRDGRAIGIADANHMVETVGPALHVDSQDVHADR